MVLRGRASPCTGWPSGNSHTFYRNWLHLYTMLANRTFLGLSVRSFPFLDVLLVECHGPNARLYCDIVLGSTNCSIGRPSFPFVGPHRRYSSPSFLKKPISLSAGCRSAASCTPFNVLSASCNVFNVSLFMFNTLSCDLTCGGLSVLCECIVSPQSSLFL